MKKKEALYSAIMKFMKVSYQCYNTTNYSEDRKAFQSDIVLCAKWLIEINEDGNIQKAIEDILDTSTAKHISDYYKQGKFGDEQAIAFEKFINEIKKINSLD